MRLREHYGAHYVRLREGYLLSSLRAQCCLRKERVCVYVCAAVAVAAIAVEDH